MRLVGDPLADRAVAEVAARRPPYASPLRAVEALAARGEPACRRFVVQTARLPDWVDFEAMLPGHRLSLQNAIPGGIALLAGSLIESYAAAKGAKVLVRTGRLERDAIRRVYETAYFVSSIARSGGAPPGTEAFRTILEVRLVHAWVRRSMLADDGWDAEQWGHPVNQEDYAWTLMMFSHVFRRALTLFGIEMDERERDSSHHTWRWVGHLMGVDERLLSVDRSEERELYLAIASRQAHPDEDSRLLTHRVLDVMSGRPPFFLPREGLHAASRRIVGPRLADELELRDSRRWRALMDASAWPLSFKGRLMRRLPGAPALAEGLGRGLVQAVLHGELGGGHTTFSHSSAA
jgi:hypothetical protein